MCARRAGQSGVGGELGGGRARGGHGAQARTASHSALMEAAELALMVAAAWAYGRGGADRRGVGISSLRDRLASGEMHGGSTS